MRGSENDTLPVVEHPNEAAAMDAVREFNDDLWDLMKKHGIGACYFSVCAFGGPLHGNVTPMAVDSKAWGAHPGLLVLTHRAIESIKREHNACVLAATPGIATD